MLIFSGLDTSNLQNSLMPLMQRRLSTRPYSMVVTSMSTIVNHVPESQERLPQSERKDLGMSAAPQPRQSSLAIFPSTLLMTLSKKHSPNTEKSLVYLCPQTERVVK